MSLATIEAGGEGLAALEAEAKGARAAYRAAADALLQLGQRAYATHQRKPHQGHGQRQDDARADRNAVGVGVPVAERTLPHGLVERRHLRLGARGSLGVAELAELVGRDTKTDIALLKVKTDKPLAAVDELDRMRERYAAAGGAPVGFGGAPGA